MANNITKNDLFQDENLSVLVKINAHIDKCPLK